MHRFVIRGQSGKVLTTVWSERPLEFAVAGIVRVDGVPLSVQRVHGDVLDAVPAPPAAFTTDFLRYHVLFRVFDGDIGRWRAVLDRTQTADLRFLEWLERRLHVDPSILAELREMVDASGLWPVEPAN
jgi:hypothetical protein